MITDAELDGIRKEFLDAYAQGDVHLSVFVTIDRLIYEREKMNAAFDAMREALRQQICACKEYNQASNPDFTCCRCESLEDCKMRVAIGMADAVRPEGP